MRLIGGRAILDRVVQRLEPQCEGLVLNANGAPGRLARFGLPVVADTVGGHPGPLAGILAALEWTARNRPGVEWVVSVAGDCPFLPRDLVARLHEARTAEGADLAMAASGGRKHPVIGLWKVALRDELRRALIEENLRAVGRWAAHYHPASALWRAMPVDPFFNANTIEDLREAERLAALLPAVNDEADRTMPPGH